MRRLAPIADSLFAPRAPRCRDANDLERRTSPRTIEAFLRSPATSTYGQPEVPRRNTALSSPGVIHRSLSDSSQGARSKSYASTRDSCSANPRQVPSDTQGRVRHNVHPGVVVAPIQPHGRSGGALSHSSVRSPLSWMLRGGGRRTVFGIVGAHGLPSQSTALKRGGLSEGWGSQASSRLAIGAGFGSASPLLASFGGDSSAARSAGGRSLRSTRCPSFPLPTYGRAGSLLSVGQPGYGARLGRWFG